MGGAALAAAVPVLLLGRAVSEYLWELWRLDGRQTAAGAADRVISGFIAEPHVVRSCPLCHGAGVGVPLVVPVHHDDCGVFRSPLRDFLARSPELPGVEIRPAARGATVGLRVD
ncbi:hypothetical protein M3693_02175 [Cellulosimicrobium funkei]|uniref:hypothetical protein n=1 Tax=Cellulosimicrobium funkei TaxID=264251 RepID=UPI00203E8027|nr:hypothetical protein [Cellulosimicrobium funkei]MCM3533032.1 hypothetical protein [Cellulosimicrobium funkei]